MKRIANTLPLLALTALLLPACSFSMQAGKGSAKNPNPTARPNPGGNSGGSSSKKVTKSNGGGGGSDSGGASSGGDSSSDGASEGTGAVPPKGDGRPNTKETTLHGIETGNSGGGGSSTITSRPDQPSGPGGKITAPSGGDQKDPGKTLTSKPAEPEKPGERSPN